MQIFYERLWHSVRFLSVLQTVLTIQREDSVKVNCDKLQDYFFLIATLEIVSLTCHVYTTATAFSTFLRL